MAQQQTIKFIIHQDGTVEERVEGVQGQQCEELTRNIENKLGDVEFRQHTADLYRAVVEHDHVSVSTQEHHFPGP